MQGQEAVLPAMARDVLPCSVDVPGRTLPCVDLIAATIGPGSFTGIRAGLALAHGLGLALGVPVVGVTVGEAVADAFPHLGDRVLWTVTNSRRDHIFLERDGEVVSVAQNAHCRHLLARSQLPAEQRYRSQRALPPTAPMSC